MYGYHDHLTTTDDRLHVLGTAEVALSRMGSRSRVRANSAEWEPQSGGLGRRGEKLGG